MARQDYATARSFPSRLELAWAIFLVAIWIYGFAMIWEYYNLIFVRSALG